MLARIWAEVFGIDAVGTDDNFFDLGGHSLLATQVMARVRDVFQVEVPVRSIFESPTVHRLALAIAEHVTQSPQPLGGPIQRIAEEDAGQLLENIDQFTDEEVAALLGQLLPEGEDAA